ncbi:cubilin-like [Lineus longissimus]|uniref:cubilin-like n=1 Tax=Lineus longissimus TaxID=88925 RepID=UPI002B4D6487
MDWQFGHLFALIIIFTEKLKVLGFKCEYRFSSETVTSGIFNSPNFPKEYPDRTYCKYYIDGSADERIRITFLEFELEIRSEAGCLFDYLELYGIDEEDVPYFVDRLCGTTVPQPIISKYPKLEIIFKSDYIKGHKGFRAKYEFLSDRWQPFSPSNKLCGADYMTGNGGVIMSPGFPRFMSNVECTWMIKVHEDSKILLAFLDLRLGPSTHCRDSFVSIYNGFASSNDRPIEKVCGQLNFYNKGVKEFLSNSFRVVIRYTAGSSSDVDTVGFKVVWSAVTIPHDTKDCNQFLCRGGQLCLDNAGLVCEDLKNYCIDNSLICNNVPNCGTFDASDEKQCLGPFINRTIIIAMSVIAFLVVAIVITVTIYITYRRGILCIKPAPKVKSMSVKLRRLENSPTERRSKALNSHSHEDKIKTFESEKNNTHLTMNSNSKEQNNLNTDLDLAESPGQIRRGDRGLEKNSYHLIVSCHSDDENVEKV